MGFFKQLFQKKDNTPTENIDLVEGDLFYCKIDNQYTVYKLLFDEVNQECYHVLTYSPLNNVPTINDVTNLRIAAYHAPIDSKGFGNQVFLTKTSIKSEELRGYHEYLKRTRSHEYYIPIANIYYKKGHKLTTDGQNLEAIDEYSKAIDLFPQFFEAIDNRAFCKMDLNMLPEAIEDFRLSLKENPNSLLATFSIGESYFKMKEYEKAKEHFEIAHNIDPENKTPILFLEKVNAILNAG